MRRAEYVNVPPQLSVADVIKDEAGSSGSSLIEIILG
jgi:hypothetical protein